MINSANQALIGGVLFFSNRVTGHGALAIIVDKFTKDVDGVLAETNNISNS
jgi:hypothetical protein